VSPETPGPPSFDLTGAFFKRQEKLRNDLGMGDVTSHPGTKGDSTELNWRHMLEEFLPRRYGVSQAFVVDADGRQSDQIDVVIHDRHFSPLLFEVGDACFIPAESVYAAFEVKQELSKENVEYAGDKLATVRSLRRTSAPVPHAGGVFKPITPDRIIGGVLTRRSGWSPPFGDAFEACLNALDAKDSDDFMWGLDIGCAVEAGGFTVTRNTDTGTTVTIDHSDGDVALIYFVMRLLRQLQAVGSAPAIDYDAYLRSVRTTD
jgi:hypothetical protein